jgi:hypothetical protein
VPGANALPFLDPQSPVGKRAALMCRHFWAARYARDELYPTGWYPNQHPGGDGLPPWTAADRPLEGENVVVWYTLNYHHLPRPTQESAERRCLGEGGSTGQMPGDIGRDLVEGDAALGYVGVVFKDMP